MDRETAEQLMKLYHKLSEPLNQATELIGKLPDREEQRGLRRPLGKLMVDIWTDLMGPIVREFPDLDPDRPEGPDGPMTAEEEARTSRLTVAELQAIDAALLSNVTPRARKVAMVVGLTLNQLSTRFPDLPDVFYSIRIQELVKQGLLDADGNLAYMRYSEVRLPANRTRPSGGA